jgi:predicted component of type VI protein secretion system
VSPHWLAQAVRSAPTRFPAVVAVDALAGTRLELRADPSPAFPADEVRAVVDGDPTLLELGLPGLRGAGSPRPSSWLAILATLPADSAARGLIDAIEHRLLEQAIAVERARPVDDPGRFAALLTAMAGLAEGCSPASAGACADGPTAEAVAAMARLAAAAPVRVVAACGGEMPLPPERRSVLGRQGRLGGDCTAGMSVCGRDLGFRLEVGPVSWDQASRLRPGGADHACLIGMLRDFAPATTCWEIVLLVGTAGAPRPALGSAGLGSAFRLLGEAAAVEREVVHRHAPTG